MPRSSFDVGGVIVMSAVRRVYRGYVFDKNSRLGLQQSGIKIQSVFALSDEITATHKVSMQRPIHELAAYKPQGKVIPLIKS